MTTVGIIGAGNIGSALAREWVNRGYQVVLANSRGPETLADLIAELGPNARAATAAEAGAAGDFVVVTVPLKALPDVPVEPLAGKVVLDTNNYYWERDGRIAVLDDKQTTTAQLVQEHLPASKVVKAFNHLFAADIGSTGSPAGTPGRRALVAASDHPEAIELVTSLYDELGFDTVVIDSLADSWRIERDTPGYVERLDAAALSTALAAAER